MILNRIQFLCFAAALLSGCATRPADTSAAADVSFAARESRLRAVANWEMRGRIAVDTGAEAWQGRFTWWQDGASLRLLIRGPLNSRAVEITGDGDELTVRTRRETRVLSDPESELSELLGWWLPITSLPSWLLGLPDQRFPSTTLVLEDAALHTLHQRAWELEYGAWEKLVGAGVPASIRLANEPLQLVVTVDDWRSNQNSP